MEATGNHQTAPGEVRIMQEIAKEIVTRNGLRRDLEQLGIRRGDILCVHSSLKRLGLVIGGVRTVIEALLDAVGPEGTVMMPTYSGDLSDPEEWRFPPVAPEFIPQIRAETPPYDPTLTPTRNMGAIPEYFRRYPGVVRSPHPQSSFAAIGARALELVGTHPLSFRFGPDSPLGRLRDFNGKVLMLGAPWDTSSFLYLCHFPIGDRPKIRKRAPVTVDRVTQWVEYEDISYENEWFVAAERMLVERGLASVGRTGATESLLYPAGEAFPVLREFFLQSLHEVPICGHPPASRANS
jgi:aminoglycoside 3-N-acetyltransferase